MHPFKNISHKLYKLKLFNIVVFTFYSSKYVNIIGIFKRV